MVNYNKYKIIDIVFLKVYKKKPKIKLGAYPWLQNTHLS